MLLCRLLLRVLLFQMNLYSYNFIDFFTNTIFKIISDNDYFAWCILTGLVVKSLKVLAKSELEL